MITEPVVDLLAEIVRRKIVLTVDPDKPDRIRYHPKDAMEADLAERILRHKSLLIQILRHDELPRDLWEWPDYWKEEFMERVAIMEYDGNIRRFVAEQEAERNIRKAYKNMLDSIYAT